MAETFNHIFSLLKVTNFLLVFPTSSRLPKGCLGPDKAPAAGKSYCHPCREYQVFVGTVLLGPFLGCLLAQRGLTCQFRLAMADDLGLVVF